MYEYNIAVPRAVAVGEPITEQIQVDVECGRGSGQCQDEEIEIRLGGYRLAGEVYGITAGGSFTIDGGYDFTQRDEQTPIYEIQNGELVMTEVGEYTVEISTNTGLSETFTLEVVEPRPFDICDYTDSNGFVTTDMQRAAIEDWRGGLLTTDHMRDVIAEWRDNDTPVSRCGGGGPSRIDARTAAAGVGLLGLGVVYALSRND